MQTVLYYKRLYLHNQLSGERNMSDIATIIIFKKENGEEFIFDDKYVQLTSLENKMLIFRFSHELNELLFHLLHHRNINIHLNSPFTLVCL